MKRSLEDSSSSSSSSAGAAASTPVVPRTSNIVLSGGFYGNRGKKRENEDVAFIDLRVKNPSIANNVNEIGTCLIAFAAIFDGHGGVSAANLCRDRLLSDILSHLSNKNINDNEIIRKSIIDAFSTANDAFQSLSQKIGVKDGCTVGSCLFVGDSMFVAWVGDTRVLLCRKAEESDSSAPPKTLQITKDHKAVLPKERLRIERAGGFVENERACGILELSRSIGDPVLKPKGVICTPEIQRVTLNSRDEFVLIGCDGLFRVFENSAAINWVRERLQQGKDCETICKELVREAIREREAQDNVTALLIVFQHPNGNTTVAAASSNGEENGSKSNNSETVAENPPPADSA